MNDDTDLDDSAQITMDCSAADAAATATDAALPYIRNGTVTESVESGKRRSSKRDGHGD